MNPLNAYLLKLTTYHFLPCRLAQRPFTRINLPIMNSLKRPVFLLILAAFGAMLAGCTSKTSKDTSIPWSRPADWEGQIPGMGSGGR